MNRIRWSLAQDACSEIRRQVYRQRIDRGILNGADGPVAHPSRERELIVEFLEEEFGDLTAGGFRDAVSGDELADARSWGYPGEWITPSFDELDNHFARGERAYLFSKSGSYTIALLRFTLAE